MVASIFKVLRRNSFVLLCGLILAWALDNSLGAVLGTYLVLSAVSGFVESISEASLKATGKRLSRGRVPGPNGKVQIPGREAGPLATQAFVYFALVCMSIAASWFWILTVAVWGV